VETEREKVEKRDMEITTEEEIVDKKDEKREIELREQEERVEIREKKIQEREVEIKKKEEEMAKRVKRMVELESRIREREIEVEKREGEILRKEELEKRKEEDERERLEKIRLEKVKEEERKRLEEEDRKKKEEEELKKIEEELKKQQAQMKRLLEEEVKMPQIFDGTLSKVSRYIEDCRRYTEKKMKEETEEDKIYWIVSYVQGDRTDKWKERIVDEMFEDKWKNRKVEDMLKEIEREFGKGKKIEDDIWKGLESLGEKEDIGRGMDGFWKAVKEKEVEKKETPIVVATTPRVQTARRGGKSGFWKR